MLCITSTRPGRTRAGSSLVGARVRVRIRVGVWVGVRVRLGFGLEGRVEPLEVVGGHEEDALLWG